MLTFDSYIHGDKLHLTIDIDTEEKKEEAMALLDALKAGTDPVDLFDDQLFDEGEEDIYYYKPEGFIHIPDGEYKGYTVQDVYDMYGHQSLSKLLISIKKMHAPKEELDNLYKEAILFSIPTIRRKEIGIEDFISAYKPFLKGDTDKYLALPPEQQEYAYDVIIGNIVGRMEKSIGA